MLKQASHYRLDWLREFQILAPFLKGNAGIVGVEYASEEAAPDKFNHLLKEDFGRPGNRMWNSLRIDHDWFTTRKVGGILDEIDRLLTDAGFAVEPIQQERYDIGILSGNDIGGDFTANVQNMTVHVSGSLARAAVRARVSATSEEMRRYVRCGGHFMIVVNDTPLAEQSEFWHEVWNRGLAEACVENVLLVIHAGPKSGRRFHTDSPPPSKRFVLPDSIEADDLRQDQVYDDLYDVFKAEGFNDPAESAGTLLSATMSSVLQIHMKLSAAIMNKNKWNGERKA